MGEGTYTRYFYYAIWIAAGVLVAFWIDIHRETLDKIIYGVVVGWLVGCSLYFLVVGIPADKTTIWSRIGWIFSFIIYVGYLLWKYWEIPKQDYPHTIFWSAFTTSLVTIFLGSIGLGAIFKSWYDKLTGRKKQSGRDH